MELVSVSKNKNGDYYFIYKIQVQRGMGHQKANELIIVGVPKTKINDFCKEHKIELKEIQV